MDVNRLIEIDIRRCLKSLYKKRKWIIVSAFMFLGIGIFGALITQEKQDIYKTSASIYCVSEEGYYSETYDSTLLMMSYAQLAESRTVLERANRMMGNRYTDVGDIRKMIGIEYNAGNALESAVLKVWARGSHEQEIVDVTNAIADAFAIELSTIMPGAEVQILDRAKFGELELRAQKNIIVFTLAILIVGVLAVCVIIVLGEIFSNRLRSVKDGSLYGKINIIGVIPDLNDVEACD